MMTKYLVAVLLLSTIAVLQAVPINREFENLEMSENELCVAPRTSVVPENCQDVRNNGNRGSGIYLVQKPDGVATVFCDMSSHSVKESSVDTTGVRRTTSSAFYVSRNNTFENSGVITYEVDHLNEDGVLNLTTGVFTVPVNGIYFISFTGSIERMGSKESSLGYAFLRVNGVSKAIALHSVDGGKISLSLAVTLQLNQDDQLDVYLLWENERARLFDNKYYPYTQFTGFLVRELP